MIHLRLLKMLVNAKTRKHKYSQELALAVRCMENAIQVKISSVLFSYRLRTDLRIKGEAGSSQLKADNIIKGIHALFSVAAAMIHCNFRDNYSDKFLYLNRNCFYFNLPTNSTHFIRTILILLNILTNRQRAFDTYVN